MQSSSFVTMLVLLAALLVATPAGAEVPRDAGGGGAPGQGAGQGATAGGGGPRLRVPPRPDVPPVPARPGSMPRTTHEAIRFGNHLRHQQVFRHQEGARRLGEIDDRRNVKPTPKLAPTAAPKAAPKSAPKPAPKPAPNPAPKPAPKPKGR